ncbi:MAG: PKD domain-containing protein [Bacteroidia bacterium]|nr:PKD domain-containing protein [Bacteroidia bacterium]
MKTTTRHLVFFIVLFFYSIVALAQGTSVKEWTRKRHNIVGGHYGHPYTIFDRHENENVIVLIENIRKRLINEDTLKGSNQIVLKTYERIYNYATSNHLNSDKGFPKTGVSNLALWAKNNAFVFLIGLDKEGNALDPTTRLEFKNRALSAFEAIEDEIPDGELMKRTTALVLGYSLAHPTIPTFIPTISAAIGTQIYQELVVYEQYKFHSRSLILWLEAYDLLKASAVLTSELGSNAYFSNKDSDANQKDKNGHILRNTPRNILREQTKNLYLASKGVFGISTHVFGWKKNHGIANTSAILMAAQVLNDAGVETNIFKGNFLVRMLGGPGYQPQYSPIKWNEFSKEYLEENLFTGWRLFYQDAPMADKNQTIDSYSSYAEGPFYTDYGLLDCGIPAMRAQSNFYPITASEVFFNRTEIQNIYNWLDGIAIRDIYLPTYDNSKPEATSWRLSLYSNKKEFNYNYGVPEGDFVGQLANYVAFIGGNNIEINKQQRPEINQKLADAGNIVLRKYKPNDVENKHSYYYFHMLAERGTSVDIETGLFGLGGTHEDDDLGSFMIYCSGKTNRPIPLAVDPPYMGWNENKGAETNRYWMHNVIEIDNGKPAEERVYKNPKPVNIILRGNENKEFTLSYDFSDKQNNLRSDVIKRNTFEINQGNTIYYMIADYVDATNVDGPAEGINLTFNGNGRYELGTPSFLQVGNLYKWFYPCISADSLNGWQISSHHAALAGAFTNSAAYSTTFESNTTNGTRANGITNDNHLTRLKFYQPNKRKTIFQSVYFPQKCGEELPKVFKLDSFENKLVTIVEFKNQVDTLEIFSNGKNNMGYITDTVSHFHLAKWTGAEADSVQNPFQRTNEANKKLYFNAQKLFVEKHSLAFLDKRVGFCPPTYAHFRNYFANAISYLIYGNDTLFYSDKLIDADFALTGRHTYHFKITPRDSTSSSDSIKIKLPDVARGTDMVAILDITADTLQGRYDSLSNFIYLVLPQQATGFSIMQKDLCADCYFPPVGTNFDTLFVANDGLKHILGNSKKITANNGQVQIINSTQLEMCPGVILHNQDSLLVEGPPQSEPMNIPSCSGVENLKKYSKNSMLVVSPYAALVLDATSKTYIKNGAGLYIKQNGSLVVKSGALLEIGDSGTAGYGEFYAEAGAFVYIEPGAIIRYRRVLGDTLDKNYMIFGMNSGGVIAGLPYQIDSILIADSIIPNYNTALAICDLDSLNPIGNRQWGYTNFGKPEAKFFTRSLNLCAGEPFHISLKRMLNDATLKIKVCKLDSILVPDGYGSHVWKYRCLKDSLALDSVPPDPTCVLPRISPEEWTWYFPANTLHRVQITVTNECGKLHDTLVDVRVLDSAQIDLIAPSLACEGTGTVKVLPILNQGGMVNYAFEVNEVLDSSNLNALLGNATEDYSFQTTGILPDTFSFPGMYFKGGRKYQISFSYISNCGVVTAEKEVNIPTGAFIKSERPTAYASPLQGARSVQLHGFVSLADSFSWWPTTYLNRSDTLVVISTPEDPIAYVLQAFSGSCMASDTLEIRYNRIANAGEADTVCLSGNEIVIGNGYDASLFLGYLFFKGRTEFRAEFIDETTTDNAYFQDFTRFMHTESFKDWIQNCGNLKDEFSTDLLKEVCIKKTWFGNYFKNFYSFSNENIPALDDFVNELNADSVLNANFNNTGDWASQRSCIPELFARYDNFKTSNVNDYSISWTKISGEDTLSLLHYSNLALAIDSPRQTTVYIQQAITPTYAEFDETITYVDTLTEAGFIVAFQMDSSVYFENVSIPESNSNSYSWNFGDGTSSTSKHAFHTYPKFDTSYVACLQVTNQCGSFMYCDTVYIDSAHWNYMNKVTINTSPLHESIGVQQADNLTVHLFPNPAESQIFLSYQSTQENFEGRLIITDSQGKQIWETVLVQNQALIKLPSESWNAGLYVFKLQNQFKTKQGKFVLMR